ncbi:hypothetical protein CKO_02213 [Citrobacter koseri ATCC BAA-895]|uniref:Uncharacterized protein n=1 Tax=Citrobacter koseri (strain ATCC BAA-895 / CDC 4225-83 / SGSC4696) TaxID=290338 RepID=A8AIM3_CITK8|nr:hypothetical protein CKO_02213 [Citrobacter koseri ATCC BAA-895]
MAPARDARPFLLAADDSGASLYFPGHGKANCPACRTNHRLIIKTYCILSCFPLHTDVIHGRMRTKFY